MNLLYCFIKVHGFCGVLYEWYTGEIFYSESFELWAHDGKRNVCIENGWMDELWAQTCILCPRHNFNMFRQVKAATAMKYGCNMYIKCKTEKCSVWGGSAEKLRSDLNMFSDKSACAPTSTLHLGMPSKALKSLLASMRPYLAQKCGSFFCCLLRTHVALWHHNNRDSWNLKYDCLNETPGLVNHLTLIILKTPTGCLSSC